MKIPEYFKVWFEKSDIANNRMWAWTDIDQDRLIEIAWRSYQQGVVNTNNRHFDSWEIKK